MKYQSKIIHGSHYGSVNNELSKLLESVEKIVSVTQSSSVDQNIILVIIYEPKEAVKIKLNECIDSYNIEDIILNQ